MNIEIRKSESRIHKIGIIGEGKMGTGIFNYLLDFNFDLVWVCSPQADAEKLNRQFSKRIKRALDAGIMVRSQYENLIRTPITTDLAGLNDCDLVIEAIPELLELKKKLFAELDPIVQPAAIFASNSSSINPSEMVPPGIRGRQFTGLHFFYPVSLKNLVELTVTADTTVQTVKVLELFLDDINRRSITLDEKNSFMLNKIFLDFQNEAFHIVQSGHCSYSQMDQLVKDHLFPFGVFDFCDSVGIDTMLASILNYTRDYPNKSYYSQLTTTLAGLVAQGSLGMKTQQGFYHYPMEEFTVEEPENAMEIVDHLYQTWLSSVKRYTSLAHIPINDANHAIKEYFDISKGPFDKQ